MSERMPTELARRVGLVLLDVDGVLSDGGLYLGRTGEGTDVEFKRFEITDQLGIKMMIWAGIPVVLVSGRPSPATKMRAAELEVPYYPAAGGYKYVAVERALEEHDADWEAAALVADDLADLPALRDVGLPVAVANAVPEVLAAARWRTRRAGGRGAVREFAEALLRARGEWAERVRAYCEERSRPPESP